MIPKPFDEITAQDIRNIVSNAVAESRDLEYKRDLPGTSDEQKREFLADVSSFSNTSGGDVIYGISEQNGVPDAIAGIQVADQDAEIRRLDSIITSGLEPRIVHQIRIIEVDANPILIVRVGRSWNRPHRVIFRGHDKFYGRTSAGKYALDVSQLRNLFAEDIALENKIRDFRINRILDLKSNEAPARLIEGSKLVVHLLPFASFSRGFTVDVKTLLNNFQLLRPLRSAGGDSRYTFEGILASAPPTGAPCRTYIHVYRSGIVEFVEGTTLNHLLPGGGQNIPSLGYESLAREAVLKGLAILRSIGVPAPVAVGITLTDVKGARLGLREMDFRDSYEVTQTDLLLPEGTVSDMAASVDFVLKPIFDSVWNASGLEGSEHFNAAGEWAPRQR